MHLAVIGTGVVGVCTAAWLLRDGHRITFVDPNGPAEACSFGNAGSISPSACLPVGMPGMWRRVPGWLLDDDGPLTIRPAYLPRVMPWLARFLRHSRPSEVRRIAGAMRALLAPVFDCYEPLLQRAGASGLLRREGCLYVYSSRQAAARWQWGMDLRRALGVELREMDEDALLALEPDLRGRFRYGLLAPDNGAATDPAALVRALYDRAVMDGAAHLRMRATRLDRRGNRLEGVMLHNGERLDVDGVVLAAGAWSARLAGDLGLRVPLETQRGYHATLPRPNVSLTRTVMAVEENIMINPMSVGLRLAGTVEFAGLDAPPRYERAEALLRRGRELFPHLDTTGKRLWMGHRPCLPDSMPVVGRAPLVENAWLGFGHGHVGMCGGASTGREIAHLVAGRPTEIDLHPFRPDRFHLLAA
ncbi:MAG: FAD-dependent oxidoreductase [Pararhodobacter sp.]|nr:FAD-dependent oxidoreductase [Pararhodobacter sp.]